jgi:hypothetical protein
MRAATSNGPQQNIQLDGGNMKAKTASGLVPTAPWALPLPDVTEVRAEQRDDTWEEQYAYSLGLQAYIYGFPWMYYSQVRWLWTSKGGKALAEAKGITAPWAPINSFYNVDHLATPDDATGGSPNHDTLYSVAWLDLGPEPVIISVPAITDRFWCMEMACMDSDNFAYLGCHVTGNAAANYLVGGPGWQGKVPDGVLDVLPRSRTPGVLVLGRTGVNDDSDPSDIQTAISYQQQYKITPLSAWPGGHGRPEPRPPHAEVPVGVDYNDARGTWITMNRAMTENPGSARPLTVTVAPSQPTERLGMWCRPVADKPGGSAKQNGSPSPRQVSCTTRSPDRTVTR